MTHREMDADEVASGVEAVYQTIRQSFERALSGRSTTGLLNEILATVDDAVVNNFDELLATFYSNIQPEKEPNMSAQHKWRLLYSRNEDHKLFREVSSGRLALADNSGYYPPDTDDGVLYVDIEEPIRMGWSDQDKNIIINLPLRTPDGTETRSNITPELAFFLANSGMQIRVNYSRYRVTKVDVDGS